MLSLDVFTGLVFLTAGTLRIICKQCRANELIYFGLQNFPIIAYLIIIYELYLGYHFVTNKYKDNKEKSKFLLKSLLYLLPITMGIIFINNYKEITTTFYEICTYQPTSMSLILHFTYFLITLHLYKNIHT
jgi:hypothetical protein